MQQVMTRSIQEILSRGQKIDSMSLFDFSHLSRGFIRSILFLAVTRKSEQLVFESRLYEKRSQWLNTKLFWRKWAPVIVVAVIVLLVIYLRFWWFS